MTIYVLKIPSNKPNGMVLNPLDQVNIRLCATTKQGDTIIKPRLDIAFINLQKEILGEYTA